MFGVYLKNITIFERELIIERTYKVLSDEYHEFCFKD